jgi:hypothetical protein
LYFTFFKKGRRILLCCPGWFQTPDLHLCFTFFFLVVVVLGLELVPHICWAAIPPALFFLISMIVTQLCSLGENVLIYTFLICVFFCICFTPQERAFLNTLEKETKTKKNTLEMVKI